MCVIAGISLSDMNKLNLNEVNIIADGLLDKREMQLNDALAVAHTGSILNSLTIWGSKDFPKEPPKFRLKPMSAEEEEQLLLNQIMKVGMLMTLEAERPKNKNNDIAYNNEQAKRLYEKFVAEDIDAIDKEEI